MPTQRPALMPFLNVHDGAAAVTFYKTAFGAEVLFMISEGSVVANLSIAGAEFWLADDSPLHQNFSPPRFGGSTVRLVLVVDDPDTLFARAIAAGAQEVWAVEDQHYHWRMGRVVDPFGHHWEIGKPIP